MNILKRGAAALLILYGAPAFAGDVAAHWQILPDKSAIEWMATYGGKEVHGSFPEFTADIAFDADHVESSRATIKIDTAKVKSDDKDAQENLPTRDWFASSQFPQAIFSSTGFKHITDDQYEATGLLAMRDVAGRVTLPFTVKFYEDKDISPAVKYARVQGELTVKRTMFGIGQGDWSQTDTIADDVKVTIRLEAKQVP